LQRGDVPPDGAGIDCQSVRELPSGRQTLRLKQLEQLEEASGGGQHRLK
jgi:hypothetical protein